MQPAKTPDVFNKEIAELEQKLEAKKRELLESSSQSTPTPEKHLFKEVIREHAFMNEGANSSISPASTQTNSSSEKNQSATSRVATHDEVRIINEGIAEAFVHGIQKAVRKIQAMNDPFLIDLLHDRLVDEYYQKLIATRKIKSD